MLLSLVIWWTGFINNVWKIFGERQQAVIFINLIYPNTSLKGYTHHVYYFLTTSLQPKNKSVLDIITISN
jgi:hypothetical protein